MNKKGFLRGFTGILALFTLITLLAGCPDDETNNYVEVIQKFFGGVFGNVDTGQIELFVKGFALTNQRTLARSLAMGSEIIAHVEHGDLRLRLEGAYDPKSDGFVLSAMTADRVYSVFGQLDFDGDFQFAEISVTEKEDNEWKMRSHLITHDPTVSLSEDGFDRGLGGVPSGLAGNIDEWIPWFKEDENFRKWTMISPAAMVGYQLDPEKGFPEENHRWNFVHFQAVGANEANVITMYSNPTQESLDEKFPVIEYNDFGEGIIDEYGNTHWRDAIISAAFNKASAGWGDLDRYYEANVFNAAAVAYIQQNKAAITKAFDDRDDWAKENGSGIWWVNANMILTELWDEWLDREEIIQSDPSNPWYVEGWTRAAHFAQRQANGEVFTVDGVHYKVWWDWSFKFNPFNTWRDNLTQVQWEQIQNITGKVFHDYVWKYRRDLLSNAYQESFLLSKGVQFTQEYQRYRIGRGVYGTTSVGMVDENGVGWTDNYNTALTFTYLPEELDFGGGGGDGDYGGGRPGGGHIDHYGRIFEPGRFSTKFSNLLSELSGSTISASEFEGKSMSEVFVLLNNSSITNIEELETAILNYMTNIIMSTVTADEIDGIWVTIANSTSPNFEEYPTLYSYNIYHDGNPDYAGLRNSTRVRPTLFILTSYTKYTLPSWWDPNAPGKITQTVNKTLMEALEEIGPGMGFNNPGDYDFDSIEFNKIDTWGELAIAMGFYMENSFAEPPTKTPQTFELVNALNNYINNVQKPADMDDFMLDFMASGIYKDGAKIDNLYSQNIVDDTPFVSGELTFKIIFSRDATNEEKGMGEDGKGGRGSIMFLKRLLNLN